MCVLSHQRMQALHPPKPLLPRHRPPCHWGQLPQPTFSSPAPEEPPNDARLLPVYGRALLRTMGGAGPSQHPVMRGE